MSVRKFKPESYSAEKSRDESFIQAEKLLKSTKETVERSKKALREAKRLLTRNRRNEAGEAN